MDHLKYKNTVDLTVTMDHSYDGAVYMKEYTGSVYGNNSWEEDIDAGYDDPMFSDFEKYDIHPQDFPWICNSLYFSNSSIQSSYSSYFSTESYSVRTGALLPTAQRMTAAFPISTTGTFPPNQGQIPSSPTDSALLPWTV